MLTHARQTQGLPQHRFRFRPLRLAATAILLAFLAACGGGAAPGITILLSSSTVEVIRGDSQQVTIVLNRQGGASAAVQLTLDGLPADVSASFNPATLSGAATQSVLTITADPAAAEDSWALAITATAGDLDDSAQLTLDIVSLEVSGRVLGLLETPLASVVVSSQGKTTTTNGQGAFTLSGLSLPYDLVLSSASAFDDGAMHVFAGLDVADPVLLPVFGFDLFSGGSSQATVSGDLLGGDPLPANQAMRICIDGIAGVALGCAEATAGDTSYSFNTAWGVPDDMPARIHALHMTLDAGGVVSGYLGYGHHELTVSDGGSHTVDLSLDPVDQAVLSVSRISEGGNTFSDALFFVHLGTNLLMPLGEVDGPSTVELPVPVSQGLRYAVASGDDGSVTSIAWRTSLGLDPVELTIPLPAALVAPAHAFAGVDLSTVFTVADQAGRAKTFYWSPDGPNGATIVLTTTQNSVTIPDPTPYGLSLAPGALHGWTVFGSGVEGMGQNTLNGGYLAFINLTYALGIGGPGPARDGGLTLGGFRDFTTAP